MSREHRTEATFEQVAEELAAVSRPLLDDLVQEGARRMLVAALQIEVEAYIGASHRRFRVRPPCRFLLVARGGF